MPASQPSIRWFESCVKILIALREEYRKIDYNNRSANVASSVLLSQLFTDVTGKCKLPSAPPSPGLK